MTRQQKYPETSTFHYYNANPKNKITGDCVVRAISTALQIPYNQVVKEMAEMWCSTGYDMSDPKGFDKYLQSKGWIKHSQPRKWDNTKYTGSEWCAELFFMSYGNIIANIGGHHTVAIIEDNDFDGIYRYRINDIWDSTDGCIGNYWTKG